VLAAAIHGVSILLAEIGCVVALAGWLAGQVNRRSAGDQTDSQRSPL